MSVDQTIAELSGTLAQLSILVEHINGQIGGVTGRINMTLDNFDQSVAGIAGDASALTNQVGVTVRQVPNSWVFYFLLITLIVVLILLGVLIIIHLATKIHAIYRICFTDTTDSGLNTPLPSHYSETKLLQQYENSLQRLPKSNRGHISLPMETEPRRPLQTAFESGVNPTFREGYPTVRTTNNNNGTRSRQHGTPALETMCTSFVHYGTPTRLTLPSVMPNKIERVESPLVVEPAMLGKLRETDENKLDRPEWSNNSFRRSIRRLPTVECNTAGNIVVGRAASATGVERCSDDWVPINFGHEVSPPPPAPQSHSPNSMGQKIVLATDSFQSQPPVHQPYIRRPQPVGSLSHASTPSQEVPPVSARYNQAYMISKTEPV